MSDLSIRNSSYNFLPTSNLGATRQNNNITAEQDSFTESTELNNSSSDRFVPSSYESSSSVPKRSDMMRYSQQGVRSQTGAKSKTLSTQGSKQSKRTGKTSSPQRANNVDYGLKVAREHYRRTTYNSSDILQWSGKADPKDPGVVIITASSNDRYSKEKLSCKVVNGKVTEWSRSRSDSDSVMGEMGVGRPR